MLTILLLLVAVSPNPVVTELSFATATHQLHSVEVQHNLNFFNSKSRQRCCFSARILTDISKKKPFNRHSYLSMCSNIRDFREGNKPYDSDCNRRHEINLHVRLKGANLYGIPIYRANILVLPGHHSELHLQMESDQHL